MKGQDFDDSTLCEVGKIYIKGLCQRDTKVLESVNKVLTMEEYKSFWKKKRESTATSPFGLHIGHYKAACEKEDILEVHWRLLTIPFLYNYFPERWCSTVQVMLEKDPGRPWIHRFRIIELFDAQVNMGFQVFIERRMVYNAVDKHLLHDSSYGSTPGRTCQEACIQKVLTMDMMRMTRAVGGVFDCDATGCYDRILPAFQSIHTRRLGLQKNVATFVTKLMYRCKRYVKTKFGISTEYSQSKKGSILYGIGQGNGGRPGMWLAHLIPMFQVLGSLVKGMSFKAPDKETTYGTVGVGFVDDVTLGTTVGSSLDETQKQIEDAVKSVQEMGQIWEKELYTTGGKLELSKCFWLLFAWTWRAGFPKLVKKWSKA